MNPITDDNDDEDITYIYAVAGERCTMAEWYMYVDRCSGKKV